MYNYNFTNFPLTGPTADAQICSSQSSDLLAKSHHNAGQLVYITGHLTAIDTEVAKHFLNMGDLVLTIICLVANTIEKIISLTCYIQFRQKTNIGRKKLHIGLEKYNYWSILF